MAVSHLLPGQGVSGEGQVHTLSPHLRGADSEEQKDAEDVDTNEKDDGGKKGSRLKRGKNWRDDKYRELEMNTG